MVSANTLIKKLLSVNNCVIDGFDFETDLEEIKLEDESIKYHLSLEAVLYTRDFDEEEIAYNIREMSKDINYDNAAELYKLSTSLQLLITDRINESLEEIDYYERFARENVTEEKIPEFSVRSSTDNEDGENNARAYTNIKLAYDNIKTDFYQRLND